MMRVFMLMTIFLLGDWVTAQDRGSEAKKNDPEEISFEGLSLQSELKSPGEFYFESRGNERFDDLTKSRNQFRKEMKRDAIQAQ